MSELSILTVHAHPDDESSKGPGTIRRYTDEGIRTTLVCCTGGEAGDILNPAMDRPEVAEWLSGPFYKAVCKVNASEFEKAILNLRGRFQESFSAIRRVVSAEA